MPTDPSVLSELLGLLAVAVAAWGIHAYLERRKVQRWLETPEGKRAWMAAAALREAFPEQTVARSLYRRYEYERLRARDPHVNAILEQIGTPAELRVLTPLEQDLEELADGR